MKTVPFLAGCCLALLTSTTLRAAAPLVVHEWGTFTSLQDDRGQAIGGINVDDEPAPDFIHYGGGVPVLTTHDWRGLFGLPPYDDAESESGNEVTFGCPDVTLRLETPVLYVYPPNGQSGLNLKVHVDFHGGILGQFYPYAKSKGFDPFCKTLSSATTSSLDWKIVGFNWKQQPIETTDKVWTTPREVSAPTLAVDAPTWTDDHDGKQHDVEVEKFLFYRGVAHLDAPLSVVRDCYNVGETDKLSLFAPQIRVPIAKLATLPPYIGQATDIARSKVFDQAWLADIRPDGTCAFHALSTFGGLMSEKRIRPKGEISSKFTPDDFRAGNLAQLKASMQDALVKEGLYPDEASAMLRTWELSYFKSPGLRLFYTVPREWTDTVLPLKITGQAAQITRVMIGRIELISDEQKSTLARLSAGPCPDLNAVKVAAMDALNKGNFTPADKQAYLCGEKPLSGLGISVPPLLQDYLSLGRFRDALIMHEQQLHPSPALAQFIKVNCLASQPN